ncbi:hypothetical protein Tco_0601755 [Tanacetum coccineum]
MSCRRWPEVSEDVFDVDLSKRKEVEKTLDEERVNLSDAEDGGLFDNVDRDLTDSEEDNVEWSPENLRVLVANVEARE